jgi:DNA ligase-1
VLLDNVVRTSAAVAASAGRLAKTEHIAALLRDVPAAEIGIAVCFLSGDLTQRQIGVGYAALTDLLGSQEPGAGRGRESGPPAAAAQLSLTDTDQVLEQIGALAGQGSQAERRRLLAGLLARATGPERQFLVQLLAGGLRQGALDGVMTEAIARAAGVPAAAVRRAHQFTGSLPATASIALSSGDAGQAAQALDAVTLQVGRPVRPMLAASAPTVAAAMERIPDAAVDWKIDGIRVQLHLQGPQVRVFTRTLDDITDRVPEIAAAARAVAVQSAVLDGEAIALRPDGRPYPFQVTSSRAASQSAGGQPGPVPLSLFLFDVLSADGADLTGQAATERFARLTAIAPAALIVPRLLTSDPARAEQFFAAAIEAGHEGVVIKSVSAPYGTGRRGSEWIKVKPRHTLDLIVLGAEWGHGRRQGWLSNLHLGARDPETGGTVMLGKTFKGLTDELLAWQTRRLLELAETPPGQTGPGARGLVRVRPVLVAEIAFDGVQASSRYPGGVTLRFARVLRYRPDKSAAEADTIGAVRALWPGDDLDT